jgi:DNA-binding NtrC family response regulator
MRAAPADAIGPASDPVRDHLARRGRRTQEPAATVPPPQPKIAERPARSSVQRLLHLTDALLRETETLARDKAFTDESNRIRSLNFAEGIDFYGEVERFETGLIRLALDQTGGHQARAAQLLRIKPSTLNSKIKLYGIEY